MQPAVVSAVAAINGSKEKRKKAKRRSKIENDDEFFEEKKLLRSCNKLKQCVVNKRNRRLIIGEKKNKNKK